MAVLGFLRAFGLPQKINGSEEEFVGELLLKFSSFPYENVSKIIQLGGAGWNPDQVHLRMPKEILNDYLNFGLGGTCFSLTYYLKQIMDFFLFKTEYFLADMKSGKKVHSGLILNLNGKRYLLDPGYLLKRPVLLSDGEYVKNVFADIFLEKKENRFYVYTYNLYAGKKFRYSFYDKYYSEESFFSAWKSSFEKNSMNYLCITKTVNDGQLFFMRDFMRFSTYHKKENIKIKREQERKISKYFNMDDEKIKIALALLRERKNG